MDTSQTDNSTATDRSREAVVLIHGLGGNRLVMWPMQRRLASLGYRTIVWRYWSHFGRIEQHAERLATGIERLASDPEIDRIHLVGHSLGSVLIRTILRNGAPDKLGRLVFLAPPSRGSPVATRVRPLLSWAMPVYDQLSDRADSFVNSLPGSLDGHEVGLITAATDILVPPENTHLDDTQEHRTLNCRHLTIVWRTETVALIDRFLHEGTFGKAMASATGA